MGTRCGVGRPSGLDARTTGRPGPAAALSRVAVLAVLLFPSVAPPAFAAGRVALVVGNSTYEHIGRLPNPANDAADVGAALRRLGFEVTEARDAGREALTDALRSFTRQSAGADVALVFYAGHGMEMDGVNYLLPVDARLERDTDVRYETVTLDDVLASTSGAGLRLVILDACRNNPLARSMRRTSRTRNVSNGSLGNLNEDLLGDETLVAYSAAAGTTADDGEGRNSPYASALLAHLEDPVDIGVMFRRVRARVLSATNERQRPHEYSSLLREHYMGVSGSVGVPASVAAGGPASPSAVVVGGLPDPVRAQQETVFWQSVENSTNAADFEAYLATWPNGVYASLARNRLAALRAPTPDPSRPSRPSRPNPSATARPDPDPVWTHADGDVFRDCPSCPEMVMIPAGTFRMGSPESEEGHGRDERPQHQVTLRSFALGATEVTFDEWDACVRGGGCDSRRPSDQGWGRGARPVINVSWDDAQAYVSWLSAETRRSYRLPSESEWEYAARAGTTTPFHTGTAISTDQANYRGGRYRERTTPVRTFAPNAFGLYDVHGNVWEWVADCPSFTYRGAPDDGTAWIPGGRCPSRVLRGGSWADPPPSLRSANRLGSAVGVRSFTAGFRVARMLD